MRVRLARFLIALALCATSSVLAQTPPNGWPSPGDGFDWQPLGDRPIAARGLAFDVDTRLWAASSIGTALLNGGV